MTPHPLYTAALEADASFDRAIAAASNEQRTRWTMQACDWRVTRVKAAYDAKLAADAAWLAFLQADSLERSADVPAYTNTVTEYGLTQRLSFAVRVS
jgi:hypothetical protein